MNYKEARKELTEYYETFKPEGGYAEAIIKGIQAFDDCLEMGLNGEEGGE